MSGQAEPAKAPPQRDDANREMDQDREGDVRPTDGLPAAGTGFGPRMPDPQADEGERKSAG